ncbi:MAG: hypothetical protein HKN04_06885 [Rhodothermaceae bacterium]|nr:hypothetical protein [Rhodothermaceae bacterium]
MRLALFLLAMLTLAACGPDEPTNAQPVANSPRTDEPLSTDTDSIVDRPDDSTEEPVLTDSVDPTGDPADFDERLVDTPAGGFAGSCDLRASEMMCYAFTGSGWTLEAGQTECAAGTFEAQACPTADRIGECVYQPGGDAAREITYTFYAPMDPLIAEGVCRGTFRRL